MSVNFSIRRLENVLSETLLTVNSAAVQISGEVLDTNGQVTSLPGFTKPPSANRQALWLTNDGASNIFVGCDNTVTNTTKYVWAIPAGMFLETDVSGQFPLWVYSDGAGGSLYVVEVG